ncbi:MAG: XdhC family protein [Burkholderiales bacterium]
MVHELDLLELAAAWRSEGRRVALATVVAAWGSSPHPPGSQLLADDSGRFMGSVSGGCIEGEVMRLSLDVIDTGEPALLDFGIANEDAWSVGLSCGGRIEVFVEPVSRMKADVLSAIFEAKRAKVPVALLTQLSTGEQIVVGLASVSYDTEIDPGAIRRSLKLLAEDRSARFDSASGPVFIQVFNPPFKLIVVGAVHIAQPLARLGALAGYEILIIDPRGAFAEAERFDALRVDARWPDLALAEITADRRTALVTLTHDPKLDDPALAWALRSPASCIGALGSRKTHGSRLDRLAQLGFSAAECARIHGPVGLGIGAVTPAEIAISIMAQITKARRAKV